MAPEIIGIAFLGLAVALLIVGVHIGIVLAFCGVMGSVVILGNFSAAIGLLKSTPYASISVYELSVMPLFILMGEFSLYSGISAAAYTAINSWMGKIRGGLAIATTWACAAFGATSGSSLAAASVFTKVAYPEMRKAGYEPNFACAGIATASTLAMLIPPSLYMVIYGVLAKASIAQCLMAGFLPGILMAAVISFASYFMVLRNPKIAPALPSTVSLKEKTLASVKAWPMILLALIIIGGIYSGVFTPTEASATGAFATLVIGVAMRTLKWHNVRESLMAAAFTTALLNLVIMGASIFARLLTICGVPVWLGSVIQGLEMSPIMVIGIIIILFLIIGCFIDALSIMFIFIPIFVPILNILGVDLIYFAVLATVSLNMGTLTPPFGLCVYTVKAVAGQETTVTGIFRACIPYYVPQLIALVLLIAFPQISLLLPATMLQR